MPPGSAKRVLSYVEPELGKVAKIVLDSARRAGVIAEGMESVVEKDYARHLLRFQLRNKKRSGSLDGVSSRVAAIVSGAAAPAQPVAPADVPQLVVPPKVRRPMAPRPSGVRPKPLEAPTAPVEELRPIPVAAPLKSTPPSPPFAAPPPPPEPSSVATPEVKRVPTEPLITPPEVKLTVPLEPLEAPIKKPAAIPAVEEMQRPSFLDSAAEAGPKIDAQPQEETPPSQAALTQSLEELFVPTPRQEAPQAPLPSFAAAFEVPAAPAEPISAQAEPTTAAATEAPSADDWILQRERELAELRAKEKEEQDQADAAALRVVQEKETEDWLLSRPQPSLPPRPDSYAALHEIYFAQTAEQALKSIVEMDSNHPSRISAHAVELAANKTNAEKDVRVAYEYLNKIAEIAEKHRLSTNCAMPARIDFNYRLRRYGTISNLSKPLSTQELCRLPKRTLHRILYATVVSRGSRNGLKLLDTLKQHVTDPFCFFEQQFLCAIIVGGGALYSRAQAIAEIERRLKERMGELGKLHALLIIRAYCTVRRFESGHKIVKQFKEKEELDEHFCAALLANSDAKHMGIADQLMKEISLDVFTPMYVLAKMHAYVATQRAQSAWELFSAFRKREGFFWSPGLLNALRRTAVALPERAEVLDAFLEGAAAIQLGFRAREQSDLFPLLAKHERFEEIVDIHNRMPLAEYEVGLSVDGEASLNKGLSAMGYAPLRQAAPSTEEPHPTPPAAKPSRSKIPDSEAVAQEESPPTAASLPSLEIMLEIAKDRNWAEAEKWLDQLSQVSVTAEQESTVTLLFNCALTSAIDQPPAVDRILNRMQSGKAVANSTTYNTIMSCYSRTEDRWEAVRETFQRMPLNLKDPTTYSIILSLYGKHGQWEKAVEAMEEMKSNPATPKPSAAVYGLAIQATHRHSWEATYKLFKAMHAAHGSQSIKEIVVARVVRALESAQRTKEVAEVMEMMTTTAKKSKKSS